MKFCLTVIFKVAFAFSLLAQNSSSDSIAVPLLNIQYGFNLPSADLKDRFGEHNNIGIGFGYKTTNNWQVELEGHAIFGKLVNEPNVLDHIINEDGTITANSGETAQVRASMRGYKIGLLGGKLLNLFSRSNNSDVIVKFGVGLLEHKIKYEDLLKQVPQFSGEYVKLLDRLSNGIYLVQSVGYQYFSENRLVNFSVVFELMEGFTASRRDYDFNAANTKLTNRLDISYGIKFNWIVPFYNKSKTSERYYTN